MRAKKWSAALFFLLPGLAIYLAVIIVPALYSLYLSFLKWDGVSAKTFVGFGNYVQLFTNDPIFRIALKNNVIWSVASLLVIPTVSLLLALLLNRKFKGRIVFRGVFYFPYILSNIVVALMWSWLYHPSQGLINEVLKFVGLKPVGWLSDPKLALYSVFAAAVWQGLGAPMILFLAGLQTIPEEPYEATIVEGANSWQRLVYITLPLLREAFVIVIATTLIGAMKVFDIIYAMTGGGPAEQTQVLASLMYFESFRYNDVGAGSAISWILVIVVLIIAVPYIMTMSKKSYH